MFPFSPDVKMIPVFFFSVQIRSHLLLAKLNNFGDNVGDFGPDRDPHFCRSGSVPGKNTRVRADPDPKHWLFPLFFHSNSGKSTEVAWKKSGIF